MQAFAGIAFTALIMSAWLVGVQLLLLARRTRALPETCLGLMLICLMGLGYPLAVGTQAESAIGIATAKTFQNLSNLFINIGFAMTFVFTWKVFRPDRSWGRYLTLAAIGVLAAHWLLVCWMISGLETMKYAIDLTRYVAFMSLATGGVGYTWSSIESFRYRGKLQRRARLGLTNPEVSNRFLLWGWMGAATSASAVLNGYFLLAHIDVLRNPAAQGLVSMVGILQAALLYLTFLPPAAFARWLRAGSTSP